MGYHCQCGSFLERSNKYTIDRHIKGRKHQNYINNKTCLNNQSVTICQCGSKIKGGIDKVNRHNKTEKHQNFIYGVIKTHWRDKDYYCNICHYNAYNRNKWMHEHSKEHIFLKSIHDFKF